MLNIKKLFTEIGESIEELQSRNQQCVVSSAGGNAKASINLGYGSSVAAMFLITCSRYNTDTDTNSGLYLVKVFNNGTTKHENVLPIKAATGVTITCDLDNMEIILQNSSSLNYMMYSVLQVY